MDSDHSFRLKQEHLLDEALKETFPASDPITLQQFTGVIEHLTGERERDHAEVIAKINILAAAIRPAD